MRRAGLSDATSGVLLYCLGIFFFAVNDALGKWLVIGYSAGEIMGLRTVGALLVLGVVVLRTRISLRLHGSPIIHIVRILCSTADTFAFYYATKTLPLADVMTFYMASPLIIVALSAVFLGERVGLERWAAVCVGFLGVLIALQPGSEAFSPAALIALGGACLFGGTIVTTRRLSGNHWLPLTAIQFVGAGLLGSLATATSWTMPSLTDTLLMFVVGITSMLCFVAVTRALTLAPASLVAPFHYTSIVWAVLMGWIVWKDVPSLTTQLGVLIIVASGLFLLYPQKARAAGGAEASVGKAASP